MLLVKKFFVCRPIDTRDSEVDTRKTRFWCVEIENPCVRRNLSGDTLCFPSTQTKKIYVDVRTRIAHYLSNLSGFVAHV